jgi:hypothetical protein
MADALKADPLRRCIFKGDSIECTFSPPEGLFPSPTLYRLVLPTDPRSGKTIFEIRPKRGIGVLVSCNLLIDGRAQSETYHHNTEGWKLYERLNVISVEPLLASPVAVNLPSGKSYYDTVLQRYRWWGRTAIFQTSLADQVCIAATARKPIVLPGEPVTSDCGQESLYYLCRLVGRHARPVDTSRSPFGTTLGALSAEAHEDGLNPELLKFEKDQLSSVPLPALFSVSPSHFMVVVSKVAGGYFTINPPYTTAVVTEDRLRAAWSGYIMRLK